KQMFSIASEFLDEKSPLQIKSTLNIGIGSSVPDVSVYKFVLPLMEIEDFRPRVVRGDFQLLLRDLSSMALDIVISENQWFASTRELETQTLTDIPFLAYASRDLKAEYLSDTTKALPVIL